MNKNSDFFDVYMPYILLIAFLYIFIYSIILFTSFRKKKPKARFIIPARRYLFWGSLLSGIAFTFGELGFLLTKPWESNLEIIMYIMAVFVFFSMVLIYSSIDVLILDEGLYWARRLFPWEKIKGFSKNFFYLTMYLNTRVYLYRKKIILVSFIWKINKKNYKKLQSFYAKKTKGIKSASKH